jgi:hypothetical protein
MKPSKSTILVCTIFLLSGISASAELLSNPDFESGITGWEGRSATIAEETTQVHSGSGAVYVSGRSKNWYSVRQDILPTILANGSGTEYTYSAWIKMATTGTHEVKLRLRLVFSDDTSVNNNEFKANANDSGWTQVSNTKTISWSGALSEAWLEIANTTTNAEYYVDDCSLTSPTGNNPATFNSDPVLKPDALAQQTYTGATLDGVASDLDGDTLSYYKDSGPAWLYIATNGTLSGTPAVANAGTNTFGIRVEDGIAGSDTATLKIFVAIGPVAPEFNSDPIAKNNAVADMLYGGSLANDASDGNDDPITFTLVGAPTWLTVATNGTLSGTPTAAHLGLNEFNVRAQDPGGSNSTATVQINVVDGNALPYVETFETLNRWTTTSPVWGWSAEEWNAPQIRPVAYDYVGSRPITGMRHEQVLDVNGPVENNFASALPHSTILVDAMIQPTLRTDPKNPEANTSSQASFFFNASGKLVVYHAIYSGAFSTVSQQWTALNNTAITNGQWIRLKISCDYLSDSLRNDTYFSIELDGTTLTSPSAYNTYSPTNEVIDMDGALFLSADSGNGGGSTALSGVVMDGLMRVDDLTVSTPNSVTAHGTPKEWIESFYPGSDPATLDLLDSDGDGLTTWQEFLAGTDPTNPGSALRGSIAQQPSGEIEIRWPSAFGGPLAPYAVYCSTNLLAPGGGWELLEGNILRDVSGTNRWENPTPPDTPSVFYRPAVQNP